MGLFHYYKNLCQHLGDAVFSNHFLSQVFQRRCKCQSDLVFGLLKIHRLYRRPLSACKDSDALYLRVLFFLLAIHRFCGFPASRKNHLEYSSFDHTVNSNVLPGANPIYRRTFLIDAGESLLIQRGSVFVNRPISPFSPPAPLGTVTVRLLSDKYSVLLKVSSLNLRQWALHRLQTGRYRQVHDTDD